MVVASSSTNDEVILEHSAAASALNGFAVVRLGASGGGAAQLILGGTNGPYMYNSAELITATPKILTVLFDHTLGSAIAVDGAQEAIAWIKAAGGVAVLAHPTWAKVSGEGLNALVTTLKAEGLGGIEVHYSTHTKRQTTEYLDLAKRLDMLVTGGSDFHGITKPDIDVGTGRGDLKVPEKLLDPIKKAALFVHRS